MIAKKSFMTAKGKEFSLDPRHFNSFSLIPSIHSNFLSSIFRPPFIYFFPIFPPFLFSSISCRHIVVTLFLLWIFYFRINNANNHNTINNIIITILTTKMRIMIITIDSMAVTLDQFCYILHWGQNKMAYISHVQTTFKLNFIKITL